MLFFSEVIDLTLREFVVYENNIKYGIKNLNYKYFVIYHLSQT